MRKLFSSIFNRVNHLSDKPTFGQKRAEQLAHRLDKALADRKKLVRAEAAADDPLKTTFTHKTDLVGRKINRLTAEIYDAKK